MAKASDLMGRSGGAGFGGGGGLPPQKPVAPAGSKPANPKTHTKSDAGKPATGHQAGGGSTAPVARRPKV